MSVPAYPTYRDSGVTWIGNVPPNWQVLPLKRIVSMQSGEQITAERIEDAGNYPVFGGNGLRGYTSAFTHDGHFALIGRQGALCGNINYASGKFWASEHAVVVSPKSPCAVLWLGELLRSMDLGQYSVTAAQPGLSVEVVGNLRIPLPPPAEQSAIAAFLDRETGKIDALVAEQERLIALLKEKRQAVISQAVTKGLDPNAPMKDSGVEWFGSVPASWNVKRLKQFVGGVTVGVVVMPSQYYADEGIPALRSLNVREMAVSMENLVYFEEASNAVLGKSMLRTDDLVAIRTGKPGTTAVVGPELDGANCIDLILIRRSPRFVSRFLAYVMNSSICHVQYAAGSEGALQQHFNIETAGNLRIALPPLDQQAAIVSFLDAEVGRLDGLTSEAERGIALLKERRAALISAAVTGKIDVRGLVSPAEAQAA